MSWGRDVKDAVFQLRQDLYPTRESHVATRVVHKTARESESGEHLNRTMVEKLFAFRSFFVASHFCPFFRVLNSAVI